MELSVFAVFSKKSDDKGIEEILNIYGRKWVQRSQNTWEKKSEIYFLLNKLPTNVSEEQLSYEQLLDLL